MTDFSIGQHVRNTGTGTRFTVIFGPYKYGETMYLVQDGKGDAFPLEARRIEAVPADPRREVVAKWLLKDDSPTSIWDFASDSAREPYYESADSLLAELDKVVPSAREYTDNDGDVWVRNGDGTYRMPGSETFRSYSLEKIRAEFGPLT